MLTQLFLTGRIIKWLGVGVTLGLLPIMSVIGFATLGLYTTLGVFVAFTVLRRAGNYALSNPAREVLFTVVKPEDKYKAKNLIDTFVYRAGDQIGAWSYTGMSQLLGLTASAISFVAVPLSAVWFGIGLWLGKRQEGLVRQGNGFPATPPIRPDRHR